MSKIYSQVANLLGKSGADSHSRKEILNLIKHFDSLKGFTEDENQRLRETVISLQDKVYHLEQDLATAVTGSKNFDKFAYLVNSESYKKLEKIKEILDEGTDWEEFYGEDS